MTIEQNLESIATSLAIIANAMQQSTPVIVEAAAPAPVKAIKPKAAPAAAPTPAPAPAPEPTPTPVAEAPAPAPAASVMFPDFESLMKYTMETVGKKPEASMHIGDILQNTFKVARLGDLKPDQFDAFYAALEAL